MSRSYYGAVKKTLPEIDIVFDRFHLMQLVNKSVDKVRKAIQNNLNPKEYKLFKGNRFLLLYNYENLDPKKKDRLDILLKVNEPLMIMHTMKEQLRLLWCKKNRKKAQKFLGTWIMDALDLSFKYQCNHKNKILEPLRKLALSLLSHFQGILNYFNHRITNGKIEGVNNKIKTLKRQAYGYRDNDYFKLRLLHLHAQKVRIAG